MNKILLKAVKAAVTMWLLAGGCNLEEWAPGAALFHYLEASGEDLILDRFPYVVELAALEIARAIKRGGVKQGRVYCDYSTGDIPMQTKTPYLGAFLDGRFNELTSTVGGFTAVLNGDHYLIIDRYDWYQVAGGVDIPPVVGKFVRLLPKSLIEKLGLREKEYGWWAMDQASMIWVGKSFRSIIHIPVKRVEFYLSHVDGEKTFKLRKKGKKEKIEVDVDEDVAAALKTMKLLSTQEAKENADHLIRSNFSDDIFFL